MNKLAKIIIITLASLLGLLFIAAGLLTATTGIRLNRSYDVSPAALTIPGDRASIAEGQRLAQIHCTSCHGEDMAGEVLIDDPLLGLAWATNLTTGNGGLGPAYNDEAWIRAIRHGIGLDGKSLFIMPSNDYYYFNDSDLANLVAYLNSLPAVDKEVPEMKLSLLARLMVAAGLFGPVIRAEAIDHDAPRPAVPAAAVSAEYGDYLVNVSSCRSCHGEQLSGGKDPNPEAPPGPNLTAGGDLRLWTEADFRDFMRTGVTPNGLQRDPEFMPWPTLGRMSDDELAAIYLYLGSLPAAASTAP